MIETFNIYILERIPIIKEGKDDFGARAVRCSGPGFFLPFI